LWNSLKKKVEIEGKCIGIDGSDLVGTHKEGPSGDPGHPSSGEGSFTPYPAAPIRFRVLRGLLDSCLTAGLCSTLTESVEDHTV
jgi:hypothetical protein